MARNYVILWLFALPLLSMVHSDRDQLAERYLRDHVVIAQSEMQRSGIPASIKLGQALLETAFGQSSLSQNSNNHFGLKCKSYWSGPTYYHKDDDRNARGELIKSCFRSYPDVASSYRDHSDFLKYSINYRSLFRLKQTDYKAWARGLKSCGYATDPRYAEKLIKLIERYDLDQYDYDQSHDIPRVKTTTVRPTDTRPPAAYKIPTDYQRGDFNPYN